MGMNQTTELRVCKLAYLYTAQTTTYVIPKHSVHTQSMHPASKRVSDPCKQTNPGALLGVTTSSGLQRRISHHTFSQKR